MEERKRIMIEGESYVLECKKGNTHIYRYDGRDENKLVVTVGEEVLCTIHINVIQGEGFLNIEV